MGLFKKSEAVWSDFFEDSMKVILFRKKQLETKDLSIVKNISLGPCYSRVNWFCDESDLNIGLGGQDLYSSYKVYQKVSKNLKNLKNIIIFYGTFSQGLDNEYTCHFPATVSHHLYFGTPYRDLKKIFKFRKYEKLAKKEYARLLKEIENFDDNYIPFMREEKVDEEFAKEVALGHYKNNQRTDKENKYLEKIIKDAKKSNINVWLVIPPYQQSYRKWLPSDKEIFKNLYSISEKYSNVEIINLYNAEIFDENNDFEDYEHLNINGAIKCTNFIKEKMAIKDKNAKTLVSVERERERE